MEDLIFSLVIFVIIYLVYLITVIGKKKKLDKLMQGIEVTYLKKRYKLSLKKVNKKKIANIVALTNSFIFSITIFLISFIENNILKLLVGFIVLIPTIIISYHFIAMYFKRSEENV